MTNTDKHIEHLILRFLKLPQINRPKFPDIKIAIANMSPHKLDDTQITKCLWKLIDGYTLVVHEDYTLSIRNSSLQKSRT